MNIKNICDAYEAGYQAGILYKQPNKLYSIIEGNAWEYGYQKSRAMFWNKSVADPADRVLALNEDILLALHEDVLRRVIVTLFEKANQSIAK